MLKRDIGLAILIGMLSGCAHDAWWMQAPGAGPVHDPERSQQGTRR